MLGCSCLGIEEMLAAYTNSLLIENTAAEQDLLNVSLPGGILNLDDAVKIDIHAHALNNSGAIRTATFRLRYGAGLLTSPVDNWSAAATKRDSHVQAILKGAGATNAQHGMILHNEAQNIMAEGALAIDSTLLQTLRVTIQFSVANVNLEITYRLRLIRLYHHFAL